MPKTITPKKGREVMWVIDRDNKTSLISNTIQPMPRLFQYMRKDIRDWKDGCAHKKNFLPPPPPTFFCTEHLYVMCALCVRPCWVVVCALDSWIPISWLPSCWVRVPRSMSNSMEYPNSSIKPHSQKVKGVYWLVQYNMIVKLWTTNLLVIYKIKINKIMCKQILILLHFQFQI